MITGGIDLSVGSTLAVTGIVLGLLMDGGYSFWTAALAALVTGIIVGAVNGYLIAYLKLSPFVVTSACCRSAAAWRSPFPTTSSSTNSARTMILLLSVGGGKTFGIANPVIVHGRAGADHGLRIPLHPLRPPSLCYRRQ